MLERSAEIILNGIQLFLLFFQQESICELLLVDNQEIVDKFCHRPLSNDCTNREHFSAEQQITVN